MSSFLSPRFLKFKNLEHVTIEDDRYCSSCGYNLRGLNYGRNCPECGTAIRMAGEDTDPILLMPEQARRTMATGFAMCALALAVGAVNKLALAVWVNTPAVYLSIACAAAVTWTIGVWKITPADLDIRCRPLRGLRLASRWTQLLWLPGLLFWVWWYQAPSPELLVANVLFRGGAGVGVIALAALLFHVSLHAELDSAARKFNLVLWLLPILSLILAFVPATVPWIFVFFVFLFLLPWLALLGFYALAMWQLHQHARWSLKLAAFGIGRDKRVQETREEIDREVEAKVRPVR